MARTLTPLSLAKILDETFYIYRKHFLLFLGISAAPNLFLLLLQLAVAYANRGAKPNDITVALGGLATTIASWFIASIVTAATTLGVSDVYLDRPTSIRECFSRIQGKALAVAVASFLVSLIVGLGFVMCIAPGIYWAGLYGVAIPALVLENVTATGSLKRSSDLTSGSVKRVIVIWFLTTVFAVVVSLALNAGISMLFEHSTTTIKDIVDQVLTAVSTILVGPVSAIGITLIYYDLRVRKEAFDIEHMMQLVASPENQASGINAS